MFGMASKTVKKPWHKRFLLWISTPLRRYIQWRFKVAIYKDIELEAARLRVRKPHWTEKMVRKRARKKYWKELKKIGLV